MHDLDRVVDDLDVLRVEGVVALGDVVLTSAVASALDAIRRDVPHDVGLDQDVGSARPDEHPEGLAPVVVRRAAARRVRRGEEVLEGVSDDVDVLDDAIPRGVLDVAVITTQEDGLRLSLAPFCRRTAAADLVDPQVPDDDVLRQLADVHVVVIEWLETRVAVVDIRLVRIDAYPAARLPVEVEVDILNRPILVSDGKELLRRLARTEPNHGPRVAGPEFPTDHHVQVGRLAVDERLEFIDVALLSVIPFRRDVAARGVRGRAVVQKDGPAARTRRGRHQRPHCVVQGVPRRSARAGACRVGAALGDVPSGAVGERVFCRVENHFVVGGIALRADVQAGGDARRHLGDVTTVDDERLCLLLPGLMASLRTSTCGGEQHEIPGRRSTGFIDGLRSRVPEGKRTVSCAERSSRSRRRAS